MRRDKFLAVKKKVSESGERKQRSNSSKQDAPLYLLVIFSYFFFWATRAIETKRIKD